ncbi:MAG TPA: hypothetical protein DEB46_14780 [Myxococcales bacterium]|nr:hypothetical protein [Myxococcales bacterium]HBU49567.1 hypothetical protein [Myxococcales bacterium]
MSQRWSGLAHDPEDKGVLHAVPMSTIPSPRCLRILITDDDPSILEMLSSRLEILFEHEAEIETVSSAEEALERLYVGPIDLLLTDYDFSQSDHDNPMNGLELLREVARAEIVITSLFMTGFGDEAVAKEAIRLGAYDYLMKPALRDLDKIVQAAADAHESRIEHAQLRNAASLLELNRLLSNREDSEKGLAQLLEAVAQESDCDLCWAILRQPGDNSPSLRLSLGREDGPSLPARELLKGFDPGLRVRELDASERERLYGSEPTPERLLIHPLLLPATSDGDPEIMGYLAIVYGDRTHRLHPGRQRAVQLLVQPCESVLRQRFLHYRSERASRQTIEVLVRALELHDEYTAGHSDWVSVYARLIAIGLGWSPRRVERAGHAGLLHDIGKVRLDSSMINHAGPLSAEQRAHFEQHPVIGMEMLRPLESMADLLPAVYGHHERFEGGGYPTGVPSSTLGELARLTCIADSYDAMTSHRAYRRALTHQRALGELWRWSGRQFDPDITGVFVATISLFRRLALRWLQQSITAGHPLEIDCIVDEVETICAAQLREEEIQYPSDQEPSKTALLDTHAVDGYAIYHVLKSMQPSFEDGMNRLFQCLQQGHETTDELELAMEALTDRPDHRITRLIIAAWGQRH